MLIHNEKNAVQEANREVERYIECLMTGTLFTKEYKAQLGDREAIAIVFSEVPTKTADMIQAEAGDQDRKNILMMFASLRRWNDHEFPDPTTYSSVQAITRAVLGVVQSPTTLRILIEAYGMFVQELNSLINTVLAPDFFKLTPAVHS